MKRRSSEDGLGDFRHKEARRGNNPPAGIAPAYEVDEWRTTAYAYDPFLDPQLVWAGKAEHTSFELDVVSLHIHERISTKAILRAVCRPEPIQGDLFGETPLSADQQVEFYQHEVGWTNRLILGDSLLVMNSLLVKEGMAGKVQMIYIDPPYGIKYASNFQPRLDRRDVKDKDEDLTHEPEQIKAYRDTWKLGIHSYLTYLLARELLTESGSIFVQINDENLHLVRSLLDEVFGRENFVAVIGFVKTSGKGGALLDVVNDFLLWYAKDKAQVKYRQLYLQKELGEEGTKGYQHVELPDGTRRRLSSAELESPWPRPAGVSVFMADNMTSQEAGATTFDYEFEGRKFHPGKNSHWKTSREGMDLLRHAERLFVVGNSFRYVRFLEEIPMRPLTNLWTDTVIAGARAGEKLYAVQTNTKVVERCILMTTDPGDLVFDPTCVRKGTRVLVPLSPPVDRGNFDAPSPSTGRAVVGSPPSTGRAGVGHSSLMLGRVGVGLIPIEAIMPGDFVSGHDGKPHRVLRTIRKSYRGTMIGIQHRGSTQTLWVTADHYILCQRRTQSYGAERTWRHIPKGHFEQARRLRRAMTPAERQLWGALRGEQLGIKFRRQHPIGPYIADFYSWEAGLVIELDGSSHGTPEAQDYDRERDNYLLNLANTTALP